MDPHFNFTKLSSAYNLEELEEAYGGIEEIECFDCGRKLKQDDLIMEIWERHPQFPPFLFCIDCIRKGLQNPDFVNIIDSFEEEFEKLKKQSIKVILFEIIKKLNCISNLLENGEKNE